LICNGLRRIPHKLLYVLYPSHLGVDLLEHPRPLLQPEYHILLYQRKLHARRQLLKLLELGVRLGEERFLVLFASEGEERAFLVASSEHLARDLRFLVG